MSADAPAGPGSKTLSVHDALRVEQRVSELKLRPSIRTRLRLLMYIVRVQDSLRKMLDFADDPALADNPFMDRFTQHLVDAQEESDYPIAHEALNLWAVVARACREEPIAVRRAVLRRLMAGARLPAERVLARARTVVRETEDKATETDSGDPLEPSVPVPPHEDPDRASLAGGAPRGGGSSRAWRTACGRVAGRIGGAHVRGLAGSTICTAIPKSKTNVFQVQETEATSPSRRTRADSPPTLARREAPRGTGTGRFGRRDTGRIGRA